MADAKAVSAYAAVTVSAILWGFIGFFSRNLYAEGFSPMQVAFTRMLIGLLVLTAFLLVVDRTCFRIRKKDIWVFLLFAVFKILSDLFLFKAQVLIHLSLSSVLQLTSPYWVLLYCVILFRERVTFRKVFAICMAFFGCILVTGILSEDISFDTLGITFALLSGFAYATYTVGNKVLMDRGYSYNTVLFFIYLLSTLVCVPFGDLPSIPGKVVGWNVVADLMCMGVLMTLVPYYLQIYALKYISPVTVNIIGLLEVACAVVVGMMIYDEGLGLMNLIGMILIPASIVLMNVDVRKKLREREMRKLRGE